MDQFETPARFQSDPPAHFPKYHLDHRASLAVQLESVRYKHFRSSRPPLGRDWNWYSRSTLSLYLGIVAHGGQNMGN